MAYEALSGWYDAFTEDVPYSLWTEDLDRRFRAAGIRPGEGRLILDLCCGTGSLTCKLAEMGYEMIGADASGEMLEMAYEKAAALPENVTRPVFLCQRAEELDLYGTIDACVCCLDSVNYLTDRAALAEAFRRVSLFLHDGGVFCFDFNTPEHFKAIDGVSFVRETEDAYCVYTADFRPSTGLCTHYVDLFVLEEDGRYRRTEEKHRERAYTLRSLQPLLQAAGFAEITLCQPLSDLPPEKTAGRMFVTARKPGVLPEIV